MDLYAPITNALAHTQSTIVDLMKVFMSNEIAKQSMELEREKIGQTSRGLDLEAERNRQAAIKEQAFEDRQRQEREDRLRARGEDVAFRTGQAERTATHEGNVFELQKAQANMGFEKQIADIAHQKKIEELQGRGVAVQERGAVVEEKKLGIEQSKFNEQFGKTTIGKMGEQMGIDPYVWGYLNINKDAQTTPERFQKMLANPQTLSALPRAAIVRYSEQLKTIEKQILIEQDPAKKEQMKANYDNLSGQIRIIQDTIEKGPPHDVLTAVIKGMGITDADEAARAVATITEKWKTIKQPDLSGASRPSSKFDETNPAVMQEITTMLQDIKAGKYDLSSQEMQIIKKMTTGVTPQRAEAVRENLANVLSARQKQKPASPLSDQDEGPLSLSGMTY